MVDYAAMVERTRETHGSTFQLRVVTGSVAANVDSVTGWRDYEETAPVGTVFDGVLVTSDTTATHYGEVVDPLRDPELSREPAGIVASDDLVLLFSPVLDLVQTPTRRVRVIVEGVTYIPTAIDVDRFSDVRLIKRAILKRAAE
jgi:hypothetical protein